MDGSLHHTQARGSVVKLTSEDNSLHHTDDESKLYHLNSFTLDYSVCLIYSCGRILDYILVVIRFFAQLDSVGYCYRGMGPRVKDSYMNVLASTKAI